MLSRTRWASILLAVLVLISTACAGQGQPQGDDEAEQATGKFDWKRYEGEKITLLLNEHPWTQGVEPLIPEFEEQTGIDVNLQTFSEDLYFDKMEQALRSAQSVADVYFLPMDSTAFDQYAEDLIAPLTPFLNNPSLTAGNYDVEDFPENFISVVKYPPGGEDQSTFAIPITFETYILFANKNLVDQYLGGKMPQSMDDLIAAAEQITEQGEGKVYGSVMRGIRSDTIMDTLTGVVLNSWGDEPTPLPYNVWFDGDWSRPRLTDPRIVEGLSNYSKLVAAGPPNALSLDWPDASTLFSQGKAAFFIDASLFGPGFEDPEQSQIAGKVIYSLMPPTSNGQLTGHWMWGLGIPANSQNKGPAWYFIQWATDRAHTAEIGQSTGGAPRQSAYDDQGYVNSLEPQYARVVSKAIATSRPTAVFQQGWKEGALVIAEAMQKIAQGEDPQEVLSSADEQLKGLF
jgi:multiple sugar transport system substrate-binding protein